MNVCIFVCFTKLKGKETFLFLVAKIISTTETIRIIRTVRLKENR